MPEAIITEEEEKLERKVKPKPRSSVRGAMLNTSSRTKTSKYFQSPAEEEKMDSEDEFDMVTSTPPPPVKVKKTEKREEEEEEDSDEDEDDWEEVEGERRISRK